VHSAGDNFFVQVCADFVGIIRTRRAVREDHGARERGEFAHWEAITEIACEERIRTCQVMEEIEVKLSCWSDPAGILKYK
jgi:hypothetical protein